MHYNKAKYIYLEYPNAKINGFYCILFYNNLNYIPNNIKLY